MTTLAKIFNTATKSKYFVFSTYGELLDLAIQLQKEGKEVVLYVPDKDCKKIGEGIVPKAENWHTYVGKGYTWLIDGCEEAKLCDWLREQEELVVGTNETMAELENNRQKGNELFEKAGFNQPESSNFTDIDDAIEFVTENSEQKWVIKQNGSLPKSINHIGKLEGSVDTLYHLNDLKTRWNEAEWGSFDVDLMAKVEGLEVAASGFFNGHDWLRDAKGKVVGYLNYEEKKEINGGLGESTGEMGTIFEGVNEDNKLFSSLLLKPEITAILKKSKYQGVFDVNAIVTDEGIVALEPTSRFGIPATSYEFMEALDMDTSDLIDYMAKGEDKPISVYQGWGIVMVIAVKPFPIDMDLPDDQTSRGVKIWFLKDGEVVDEPDEHIRLENVYKDGEDYKIASKSGYVLTITGRGDSIEDARENLLDYVKDTLHIDGIKYRTDLGKRIEDYE